MPVEAKCTQGGEGWAQFCFSVVSGVLCSPYLWRALAAALSTDLFAYDKEMAQCLLAPFRTSP